MAGKGFVWMATTLDNAIFEPIIDAIDAEMRAIRAEQEPVAPLLWAVVDYQFGWDLPPHAVEERRRVAGKKIRSLLMALVAQAVGGDYRPVLPAAAALARPSGARALRPVRHHRPAARTSSVS